MMADPQTLIAYWQHGQQIVERCLEKAQQANPADAPMPLVGAEAALWHRAQMEAYRHCLEMMGYPTEADEAVLNRIIAGSPPTLPAAAQLRSEERRVGKACGRSGRFRRMP